MCRAVAFSSTFVWRLPSLNIRLKVEMDETGALARIKELVDKGFLRIEHHALDRGQQGAGPGYRNASREDIRHALLTCNRIRYQQSNQRPLP